MGSALVGFASGDSTFDTGSFGTIGNGGVSPTAAAEVDSQLSVRVSGTFSKLGALVDATGTGRVIRFRKNGANGNQSVSPTNTTAGLFEDSTNSDAVTTADLIDFSVTTSTGSPVIRTLRTVFTATSNHACFYMTTGGGLTVNFDSATRFISFGGVTAGAAQTTEANAQSLVRVGGTLQNFQCVVNNNGRTTATTFKTRINGADGTCTVSVSAGATGLFEDTTHTDTVAAGDLLGYAVVAGGPDGNSLRVQQVASAIVVTSGAQNDVFATSGGGATRTASGTATYYTLIGNISGSTTEANRVIQHAFSGSASRLRLYLSANTYSTDGTATFRIAGADGAQTVTLTAGATGWFEDTTHSDSFASTDNCCVKITGGTSGSITIRCIGLKESNVTAYTLTAAQGSFTLTGQAATLSRTRALAASQGSFALSGQAATLKRALNVAAAQGSFTLTGQAASFNLGHTVVAAQGSFTLSGQTATFRRTLNLSAAYGAYTLSGQTVTLKRALKLTADQGSFTLSGQAAALARGIRVTAARGTFTLSGQAATLTRSRAIAAAYGSFTLTGQDVAFLRDRRFSVEYGDFDLTGIAALFRRAFPGKSSAVSTSFTGRTAETNTSGFVGKSSAEATAFTGKTSAQS